MVPTHLPEVLQTPRFKGELIDLRPVSGLASVLLLLPLHQVDPQAPPDPIDSVALLLGGTTLQGKGSPETRNPEAYIAQPPPPLYSDHQDQVVKRGSVATRFQVLHLSRQQGHLEAQLDQEPGEQGVVLEAEPASVLVHDLVVQEVGVQADPSAAVNRQVLERNREQVAGVDRAEQLQAGLRGGGGREPDARQISPHVHLHGGHFHRSVSVFLQC